jgi:hypothetical protein
MASELQKEDHSGLPLGTRVVIAIVAALGVMVGGCMLYVTIAMMLHNNYHNLEQMPLHLAVWFIAIALAVMASAVFLFSKAISRRHFG